MRIAIVDDDMSCIETLKQYITQYQEKNGGLFQVTEYTDGVSFLEESGSYDLIFLDIEMPAMNGMEVAHRIREKNENVCLIFITNLAQYALQGYEVSAFDFIVKPVEYSIFEFKMDRVISAIPRHSRNEVPLKVKNGVLLVAVDDIHYVEIIKHKIIYHTRQGEYEAWDSMKNVEQRLSPFGFARCNVCFLVNLKHVTELKGDNICVGGNYLKISSPKKKEFVEKLMLSMGER